MTTDDFIYAAILQRMPIDSAWEKYSKLIGHCSREEFDKTWEFWTDSLKIPS